jgi:hypothetical protein
MISDGTLNFIGACAMGTTCGFCFVMMAIFLTQGGRQSIFDGWMPVKTLAVIACFLIGAAIPLINAWATGAPWKNTL